MRRNDIQLALCVCTILSLGAMVQTPALADETIKHPGDHPKYSVEIEPHVLFGIGNVYGPGGFGLGGRFSIPIVHNGFVPTINNSVAITFGLDWTHFDWCWYHGPCSGDYIGFPVAMQWNFYVAQRWSVFGEPGVEIYHGFISDCPAAQNCGGRPVVTGIEPAIFVGGRYHLSDTTSLTMRIGFPTFSFGFSFFL
jgi:hypothetical protein